MAESGIKSYFPSQTVSDAEKLSYDYGLKVGQAIETEWFNNDRSLNKYRNNTNDFHKLRLYARGEQSIQKYKDELSINGDLSYLNLMTFFLYLDSVCISVYCKPLSLIPHLLKHHASYVC